MKKSVLTFIFLIVIVCSANAQFLKQNHWVELGVGFHIQNGDEVIESEKNTGSLLTKIGYKYWGSGKFGFGIDVAFGDIFIDIPTTGARFYEQVIEGSLMANYMLLSKKKFDVYIGAGITVGHFNHLSRRNTSEAIGTKMSIPVQLGIQRELSRKVKLALQINRKSYFSSIPYYYQASMGMSISI